MGSVPGDVRGHNEHMSDRDVAIVLSGGGVNGVLLQLGFLRRLRESELWPRVGCIYGTSAGALTGSMASLDRLDDLEEFTLGLQPRDVFAPQRLWQLPLNGLHHYALPATLAARRPALGLVELGDQCADRRDGPEALQSAAEAVQRLGADARVLRDVAEGDDESHVRMLERAAEREVPHPAAVRGDAVADR